MDESDLNNIGRGKFWIARNVLELPHDLQASCFSKLFAAFLCWRIICVHCRQAAKYDPNKRRPLSRFVDDFLGADHLGQDATFPCCICF